MSNAFNTGVRAESFQARTERIRKGLADSVTGPLRMAKEVLEIAKDWDSFKAEAGMSAPEWVRSLQHGKRMDYYERRARAVERIGALARKWDHEAAVWAVEHPIAQDDLKLRALVRRVEEERVKNGPHSPPLCKAAVVRLSVEVWGTPARPPRVHVCKACTEKDAEIAALKAQLAGQP